MSITGVEEFIKQLEKLDKKLRNKTIRAAMRAALKPMAAEVKQEAPEDTGEMAKSAKVKSGKRKKDTITMSVVVAKDPDSEGGSIPMHVEYGTARMPANPFMLRAFDATKDQARDTALEAIKQGIESAGK